MRIVTLMGIGLALAVTGCGGCAYRPEVHYDRVVVSEAPSVDLSRRLRLCTQGLRRETDRGFVEVRYPSDFADADAEQIVEDHLAFFPVAAEVLGEVGRANAIVYVLTMDEAPPSYTIRSVRRGKEWELTTIDYLLLTGPLHTEEYWAQVGTNVHEMAHEYIDAALYGCRLETPAIRWFEDGTCHVVKAHYLQHHAPSYFEKWDLVHARPRDASHFDTGVFDWEEPGGYDLSWEEGVAETDRYAVAYRIMRYIYDLDNGDSLRRLHQAMLRESPRTQEHLSRVLGQSLALDPPTLILRARQYMESTELPSSDSSSR